jgi:hypothetical protein
MLNMPKWQSVSPEERFAMGHQMSVQGIKHMALPPSDATLEELLSAVN